MNNDPKLSRKANSELLLAKKWKAQSQSPDLNPAEHAFHSLQAKLEEKKAERPRKKQQLKMVAVNAWQSSSWEEIQNSVSSQAPDFRHS